ncbi:MAG: hypothetical protein K6B51_02555 [Bacilli bacterium]|nr:hypothetical protein [Bacilli bacterium]
MASRGVVNSLGVITTDEYTTVAGSEFHNSVVLVGNKHLHGLPDYSHRKPSRIYIKMNQGVFREMRVYGSDGRAELEIGYHPEMKLTGNRHEKVLHFHSFGPNLEHFEAQKMTKEVYEKYKLYLNHWGINWYE